MSGVGGDDRQRADAGFFDNGNVHQSATAARQPSDPRAVRVQREEYRRETSLTREIGPSGGRPGTIAPPRAFRKR